MTPSLVPIFGYCILFVDAGRSSTAWPLNHVLSDDRH